MVLPASPKLIALYAKLGWQTAVKPSETVLHPDHTHAQMLCLGWSNAKARDIIRQCSGCKALHQQNSRIH